MLPALANHARQPHLRAYYDRLWARGKQRKVALVATMRKLLLILNAIIRNQYTLE